MTSPVEKTTNFPAGPVGSTRECLRHAIASNSDSFAALCQKRFNISESTVRRWIKEQGGNPQGLYLLQVQIVLVELGYELVDVRNLDPVLQRARVFLAQQELTFEEIQKLWDMSESTVAKIMYASRELIPARARQLAAYMNKKFDGSMQENTKDHPVSRPRPIVKVTEIGQAATSKSLSHEMVAVAAALIQSLQPLVRSLASDDFSKEERTALRTLLGEGVIQEMRISIGKLVSEKTRMLIIEKQKEEKY